MADRPVKIYSWLKPLAWLYGLGTGTRNKLFEWGWLRSKSFRVPVICVGNLAVGGTGKTPHTEYLVRLLQGEGWHVATLSRGYRRKSKGYLLADEKTPASMLGDEPWQMKHKFDRLRVAVDEDRCHGIAELTALTEPQTDVILLDDAFQHRYVKPGLSILLTDYHRLFCDDALLPAGRLRESVKGKERAQIVIVTKCPNGMKPIEFNVIGKRLGLYPYQQLFFTRFRYAPLQPLFPQEARKNGLPEQPQPESVLLVTGIASPAGLIAEVKSRLKQEENLDVLAFGDHHDFSDKEMKHIGERFRQLKEGNRIVITTEKDAARLKHHPALPGELRPFIYVLPIETEFLQNRQHTFNQTITNYVRTHSRNRNLPER